MSEKLLWKRENRQRGDRKPFIVTVYGFEGGRICIEIQHGINAFTATLRMEEWAAMETQVNQFWLEQKQ